MPDGLSSDRLDDAPLAASKSSDRIERAGQEFVEPKGDSLSSATVTINRVPSELYAFWSDFSNLPRFMENLVTVEMLDAGRSRWVVKAPAGKTVEWISQITEQREGEYIAWASLDAADVPNSGRVDFIDAGERGTVVTATILYDPPGGFIGKVIAKMFQREPAIQARRDLRRFKQLMETGEIATAAWTRAQFEEEMA